jgi:N6-adenosine-specific RNA methylase IME4
MTLEDIAALPVGDLAAPDAHLFLWSTREVFREGQAAMVARSWGFEPCGEVIWGLRNPGFGTVIGSDHEPCLIARRGKASLIPALRMIGVHFWRQTYASGGKGKVHSAKPEAFLDLVESVAEGPYVELFARRHRMGWDVWGDQSANTARLSDGEAA